MPFAEDSNTPSRGVIDASSLEALTGLEGAEEPGPKTGERISGEGAQCYPRLQSHAHHSYQGYPGDK